LSPKSSITLFTGRSEKLAIAAGRCRACLHRAISPSPSRSGIPAEWRMGFAGGHGIGALWRIYEFRPASAVDGLHRR